MPEYIYSSSWYKQNKAIWERAGEHKKWRDIIFSAKMQGKDQLRDMSGRFARLIDMIERK